MSLRSRIVTNKVRPEARPATAPGPAARTEVVVPGRDVSPIHLSIEGGANSRLENNRQAVNVIVAEREYFLDLAVLEVRDGKAVEENDPRPRPLEPGRSYVVRVSPSLNRYRPRAAPGGDWALEQDPVRIQRALELFLGPAPGSSSLTEVAVITGRGLLALGEQLSWSYDFRLDVPAEAPAATLDLELTYQESTANLLRFASRLALEVAGEARAAVPAPPVYLAVDAPPPVRTAFLHILPEGEDNHLAFSGFSDPAGRVLRTPPIPRPRLPAGPPDPAAYLDALENRVYDFGQNDGAGVTAWLEEVLRRQGPDACVVLVDYVDSGLPWEMLRLGPEYLGVQARVVRFAEVQHETQVVALRFGDAVAAGRVVAYLHPRTAAPDPDDPEWSVLGVARCEALDQVQYWLPGAGETDVVGLVYLGSGEILFYGDGDEDHARSLVGAPGEAPSQVRFNALPAPPDPRPVFFTDAPFSARMPRSRNRACGLAAAVLSRVAAAYVGTMGPVDRGFAARVATRLWRQAAEPGGVQPAALLREVRADAAARLRQPGLNPPERMRAARELQYAFMYVYYGNPRTCLQITPHAPEEVQ
jgi:hypothetical protein